MVLEKLFTTSKLINGNATLVNVPVRTATDPTGPQLAYRYIESPDGQFYYPLFATEEEAKYVDVQNGGTDPGTAHTHVFVDEPTGTSWYMPDNGGTHAGASAPTNTAAIVYTEIPTLSDDQFAPAAFTLTPVTANEGDAINISLHPSGSSPDTFTTTVDASPCLQASSTRALRTATCKEPCQMSRLTRHSMSWSPVWLKAVDGIPPNGNVAAEDFQLAIGINVTDAIRGTSFKVKMYKNGTQVHNIGVGGTGLTNSLYDIVFSNVNGRWEMSLQNNFGNPVPTDAAVTLRQQDGGTWSQTVVDNATFTSGPRRLSLVLRACKPPCP